MHWLTLRLLCTEDETGFKMVLQLRMIVRCVIVTAQFCSVISQTLAFIALNLNSWCSTQVILKISLHWGMMRVWNAPLPLQTWTSPTAIQKRLLKTRHFSLQIFLSSSCLEVLQISSRYWSYPTCGWGEISNIGGAKKKPYRKILEGKNVAHS